MGRRIRVIERRAPVSFGDRLEQRARALVAVRAGAGPGSDSAIASALQREVSLVLDHIEHVRRLHDSLRRNLLQHECYLSTEILQREPRGSQVYQDYRLPERDRLRDRLRELERERRHLAIVEEDQVRILRDRLLTLLNRHAYMQPQGLDEPSPAS